jgi:hypothetical protein
MQTIANIGICPGIGLWKSGSGSWTPNSSLGGESVNFWAKGRSGLTMPDSVGANDIAITTPVYCKGVLIGDKTRTEEHIFDGSSYTLYYKAKAASASYQVRLGSQAWSGKGIVLIAESNNLYFQGDDGTLQSSTIQVTNISTNLAGWFEVFIEVDFTTKRLRSTIYELGTANVIGSSKNINIAAWTFSASDNQNPFSFYTDIAADFKKFNALKTIAQCRDKTYVTDLQLWYPEMVSGTDVSGNAKHLTRSTVDRNSRHYCSVSTYLLDRGYSLYRNVQKYLWDATLVNYEDVYVPYDINGLPIARILTGAGGTAYVKISDHPGSATEHNLAESRLSLPLEQWDKSDTNIYVDAVRTLYHYVAGTPHEWHISELDYLTFSQRCKANYKGINFFKITDSSISDRKILKEFFSFATDKTGADLTKILNFTGDNAGMLSDLQILQDASIEATGSFTLNNIVNTIPTIIYWGDGNKSEPTSGSTMNTNEYAVAAIYNIYISHPDSLVEFRNHGTSYFANGNDVSQLNKCTNLEKILLDNNNKTPYTGSIDGWNKGLKDIQVVGVNGDPGITGDVAPFIALTRIWVWSSLHGNMSNSIHMKELNFGGNETVTFDMSAWDDIEWLNNQYAFDVVMIGSITGKVHLHEICWWGTVHHLEGDIATCVALTYLTFNNASLSHISGDISALTLITTFGDPGPSDITGSLAALIDLEYFIGSSHNTIVKPVRLNLLTKICYLSKSDWVWSTAEVNAMLADVWANRNSARTALARRLIFNTVGSGAPSGQGITDKAALEAYRSPTPPGTAALWTIDTN